MKRLAAILIVALTAASLLTVTVPVFAEGIGTITQMGIDNYAYVYQELLSEVVIMQRGNENSASIEQQGAEHLAGAAQVGDQNELRIQQLGQKDLIFAIQMGMGNDASITQMHSTAMGSTNRNISDNDAFLYQSGLYNIVNLMQIGDDNTASVYQIDDHNEAFIVQEQAIAETGANAAFVVQIGIGNWAGSQQLGAHQVSRSLQMGDSNSSLINQEGIDNDAFVSQTGNQNSAIVNQS